MWFVYLCKQGVLRAAVPRELDFIVRQLLSHTRIIEDEATDGLVSYRACCVNPLYVLTPYMIGGSLQGVMDNIRAGHLNPNFDLTNGITILKVGMEILTGTPMSHTHTHTHSSYTQPRMHVNLRQYIVSLLYV